MKNLLVYFKKNGGFKYIKNLFFEGLLFYAFLVFLFIPKNRAGLKQFEEIVKMANDTKVTVLMETNGIFVDTKKLGIFLDQVKGNSGALWDTHHPYRFNDEQLSTSIKNLGSKIKYVHLKDSVINKGKVAYKIMGTGDMPIKNIVSLLQENNYDGYYTLEWVKLWDDTLEDAGIVFAQYVQYMNRLP